MGVIALMPSEIAQLKSAAHHTVARIAIQIFLCLSQWKPADGNAIRLIRADPQLIAHDEPGGCAVEGRIRFGTSDEAPSHRLRVESRDRIAAMTQHRVRLAID